MLKLWSNPGAKSLSEKLSRLLVKERGLTTQGCASLRVLEESGSYSGRKVTFFRIFNPTAIIASGLQAIHFGDLDASAILYNGHTEKNGDLVLSQA